MHFVTCFDVFEYCLKIFFSYFYITLLFAAYEHLASLIVSKIPVVNVVNNIEIVNER